MTTEMTIFGGCDTNQIFVRQKHTSHFYAMRSRQIKINTGIEPIKTENKLFFPTRP